MQPLFCQLFFPLKCAEISILLTLQVLLYDLRSSRPLLVKDHYYGLPIHSLHFHKQMDLVISADSKIIKMWHRDNVSTTAAMSISIPISP